MFSDRVRMLCPCTITSHPLQTFLDVFNMHYQAIGKHLRSGPFIVHSHMGNPASRSRNFMDALQMFWPGLQVSMRCIVWLCPRVVYFAPHIHQALT